MSSLPYPVGHDIALAAERHDARYEHAWQALSPSDVLATVDDMVAQLLDSHHHPLYDLVVHCLHHGTTQRSGKRPYMREMVGASYEPLIEAAITRLVEEKLADVGAWEE